MGELIGGAPPGAGRSSATRWAAGWRCRPRCARPSALGGARAWWARRRASRTRTSARAAPARPTRSSPRWMEAPPIEEIVSAGSASRCSTTSRPSSWRRSAPGRLSHAPRDLAALLRTAGQGAIEPVWDRHRVAADAAAGDRRASATTRYAAAARAAGRAGAAGPAPVVPGAGHAPQLERPDAVAAAGRLADS